MDQTITFTNNYMYDIPKKYPMMTKIIEEGVLLFDNEQYIE
ncbi:hypothetical protein [Virgibacillus sediminis]